MFRRLSSLADEKLRHDGRRIPAGDLERLVIDRLGSFLADPPAPLDAIDEGSSSAFGGPSVIVRGRPIADDLGTLAPEKVKAMLMALCCRIEIGSDRIDIALSRSRVAKLIRSSIDLDGSENRREQQDQAIASNDLLTLTAPASLRRVGRGAAA